jgi:hypothetical protein
LAECEIFDFRLTWRAYDFLFSTGINLYYVIVEENSMMRHISRPMVAPVIDQFVRFDTHMIETRILRLHPIAFARELLEFAQTGDPLHQFSAQFAKWVDHEFTGQIRQTHKVVRDNLGGEPSQNQEWERVANRII